MSLCEDASKLRAAGEHFEGTMAMWSDLKQLGLCYRGLHSQRRPTCGKILSHAKRQVAAFREWVGFQLCVFKIGVTSNPPTRFADYVQKGFTAMWIIFAGDDVGIVHMLEAALISEFASGTGCQNMAETGGEGALNRKASPSAGPPFYVYVTGGRADQPRRVG